MSSINRVMLSGNLTRDPELQVTQGGTPVLKFGIAVGEKRGDKDYTHFFDCIVWGKYGEVMQKYLQKGQRVAVEGQLCYSTWERDGQKRSKLEVIADEIEFMSQRQQPQSGRRDDAQYVEATYYETPQQGYAQDDCPF